MLVLYSNTLIRAPKYWSCILRDPNFKIVQWEDASGTPYKLMPLAQSRKRAFDVCWPFPAYSLGFAAF